MSQIPDILLGPAGLNIGCGHPLFLQGALSGPVALCIRKMTPVHHRFLFCPAQTLQYLDQSCLAVIAAIQGIFRCLGDFQGGKPGNALGESQEADKSSGLSLILGGDVRSAEKGEMVIHIPGRGQRGQQGTVHASGDPDDSRLGGGQGLVQRLEFWSLPQ